MLPLHHTATLGDHCFAALGLEPNPSLHKKIFLIADTVYLSSGESRDSFAVSSLLDILQPAWYRWQDSNLR